MSLPSLTFYSVFPDWMTTKGTKVEGSNDWKLQCTLVNFQDLRDREDSFSVFVQRFVKLALSSVWNKKVNAATGMSSIATVSDEAFVLLLVLENNWKRWLDVNNKSKNEHAPSKRGQGDRTTFEILPLCTNINCVKVNDGNGGNRGWNETGIERFNELCCKVKQDGYENSEVDKATVKNTTKNRDKEI
mgnify:CR=1 FL=1